MHGSIVTLNLETDFPTVEEARQVLKTELEKCRSRKVTAIKVIHGYGSSGVGGGLRQGIRKSLISRRREGYQGCRIWRKLEHIRPCDEARAGPVPRVEQRQRFVCFQPRHIGCAVVILHF
jgi:hypothetical protein